jgi:ribosomal protein S18 acetylase RimI-like enzyme
MPTITSLQSGAIEQAAITLERAFSSDPMFTWVFPDPVTRPAALRCLLRVPVAYGVRYGRVTTSHDGKAACVWIPPGPGITIPRMIRCGMLGVPLHTGLRPFGTFMAANETMEKIHKVRAPEPHWYLMVVGVDPEFQGHGLGSALVREGLALADRASQPCYLETSAPRNLALYQRLGFVVLEEATLGKGGPKAWAMRREPQPATAEGARAQ